MTLNVILLPICDICKRGISVDQLVSHCFNCQAGFHVDHLNLWLNIGANCPKCRSLFDGPINSGHQKRDTNTANSAINHKRLSSQQGYSLVADLNQRDIQDKTEVAISHQALKEYLLMSIFIIIVMGNIMIVFLAAMYQPLGMFTQIFIHVFISLVVLLVIALILFNPSETIDRRSPTTTYEF